MGVMGVAQFNGFESIENFRGQQITVLITDLMRGALQVDEDPTASVKSVGTLEIGRSDDRAYARRRASARRRVIG